MMFDRFHVAAAALTSTVIVAGARAQVEGRELFEKASSALQESGVFAADAKTWAEGNEMFLKATPKATARIQMAKGEQGWHIRIEGKGQKNVDAPEQDILVAWNGTSVQWLDHEAETFNVRPGTQRPRTPLASTWEPLVFRELFNPEKGGAEAVPFGRELDAASYVIEENTSVQGQDCRVVHVTYKDDDPRLRIKEAIWYLATSDGLPRRVDRLAGSADFQLKLILEFQKVDAKASIEPSVFDLEAPEGWRKDVIEPRPMPQARPVRDSVRPTLSPARKPAPTWSLSSASGETVSTESLDGQVGLLYFWGTWNFPSTMALKDVAQAKSQFDGQPVRVLTLACEEKDGATPGEFLASRGVDLDVLLEADDVAKAYDVETFPAVVILGKGGEVVATYRTREEGESDSDLVKNAARRVQAYLDRQ
ncbi:MAG: TlpA family protein disulfide reductase [Phycisphaerales bacterium]|nr:TlpA family protein disulfide reductase [Phycisphaerales bacterium]